MMSPSLLELAANIVSSHVSLSEMTTEELLQEIQSVHATLQKLDMGVQETGAKNDEQKTPCMTLRKAFQADQVCCMICGKGGMKTLARHLTQAHNIKPGEYRKLFNIPRNQPLTARNFSENRKKMAQERGLADNLAKARAVRAAKLKAEKAAHGTAGKAKLKKGQ